MSANMIAILGMAVVTFAVRYVLFAFAGRITFSESVKKVLQYVPPAILTAIVLPAIVMPDGEAVNISLSNTYLIGAVVTVVACLFSKNLLITSFAGMAAFFVCGWLIG